MTPEEQLLLISAQNENARVSPSPRTRSRVLSRAASPKYARSLSKNGQGAAKGELQGWSHLGAQLRHQSYEELGPERFTNPSKQSYPKKYFLQQNQSEIVVSSRDSNADVKLSLQDSGNCYSARVSRTQNRDALEAASTPRACSPVQLKMLRPMEYLYSKYRNMQAGEQGPRKPDQKYLKKTKQIDRLLKLLHDTQLNNLGHAEGKSEAYKISWKPHNSKFLEPPPVALDRALQKTNNPPRRAIVKETNNKYLEKSELRHRTPIFSKGADLVAMHDRASLSLEQSLILRRK